MPSRSARNNRYDDDPYVFDDPYRKSSPPDNAYEYVGTDDPSGAPEHRQRPHSPAGERWRRSSPPRRSRHRRDQRSPPAHERSPSPRHRASRRTSPPPKASREAPPPKNKSFQNKYHEFAQRPGVQRAQTFGRKGFDFLRSAAAAYHAPQEPRDDRRTRSVGHDDERERGRDGDRTRRHRHHDDYYDSEGPPRRSRHSQRQRHSPSPSLSPPRRRRSERSRRRDYSPSTSVSSRDYGRDGRRSKHHDRDRRRVYSYSPSPPPKHSGSRRKSTDNTSRPGPNTPAQSKAAQERWQLAIGSAIRAGGMTAFRLRKEPGSWTGDKGAKVAKAALGAAALDAFIDVGFCPGRSTMGIVTDDVPTG
ncbi:hypothetical protein DL764_006419 [Monosporascus ibericus]|uniref:Uncharacterized protein n=1 Tax=Monosporascus ibericus TaxID=155417 RepID=A0A4Q4T8H9_9PEZI|nr:hypothetical protein DL764_006419 [Monosporascus ibericus]